MTADAVGGVWTYALDLSRGLGEHGVRVCLAVLGPPPSDAQRAEVARLPHVTLYELPGRLEWMDDPWSDVEAAGEWLLALERALQPDVIHLNGYSHGALDWSAPVVVVGHSCVRSWWRAVHGEDAPRSWDPYRHMVRRGLQRATAVIAPSAAMLAALHEHYGPLPRTRVIANGRWRPVIPRTEKEPFILTAGRIWDRAKNVDAVCRVADALDWPVYVAGETKQPAAANSEDVIGIVDTSLADGDADPNASTVDVADGRRNRVHLLGRLEPRDLAMWMARASIYALPARYEPFGLSALEAGLAGCALVLGDIPSLREVWDDAAIFVPPDNVRMLRSEIAELIDDEEWRMEMSARARRRAAMFDAAAMCNEYLQCYAELTRAVRPVLSFGAV